jgi:peptidoglycan hydrolase-like protein with peptidoglycan-binding domain
MSKANRKQLQEALRRLHYYSGPADGNFGPRTRAAIRRFQRDIAAETTGSLTAEQANRLGPP